MPVHLYVAVVAFTCMLLPLGVAISAWTALYAVRFVVSARGRPQDTGCRQSPWFRGWLSRTLEPSLDAWLGSFEVIRDADEGEIEAPTLRGGVVPAQQRYVFGYHPHGEYPLGAAYLPLTPSWRVRASSIPDPPPLYP